MHITIKNLTKVHKAKPGNKTRLNADSALFKLIRDIYILKLKKRNAMIPVSRVTSPETFEPEWVGSAPEAITKRYATYYHNRKLEADAEGWTSWMVRVAARNLLSLAQAGSAFVVSGYSAVAVSLAMKNEVAYHTAGKVVKSAHAVFVTKTRVPIDHMRVAATTEKLRRIASTANPEEFIEAIKKLYTKGYLSSHSSYVLMNTLNSELEPAQKIEAIIRFLNRAVKLAGYEDLYYNNGKWLYQILTCITEKATIEQEKTN